MADVIAEEAHRVDAPTPPSLNSRRAVQRQHVKAHRISGLERPTDNRVCLALGLDVRQIGERAFGEPARLGV